MRVIYKNVHQGMLLILFHCAMLVWVHLDGQISGAGCYMMFTAVTYQILVICYFCCNWSAHLMSMSSTCVLIYAMPSLQRCMPCIFVIYVVTSTSMQTRLRDVSVFRDFGFSLSLLLLLFCCHVSMCLQWDPCFFWVSSVRMFCRYNCALSNHAPFCNYGVS